MLTTEQLQAIMPQLPAAKRAALFPFLSAAATEFAIDSPARAAAFLAQLAHESAQFRFMEEIWGPTPAQRRYEPQSTLATVKRASPARKTRHEPIRSPRRPASRSSPAKAIK